MDSGAPHGAVGGRGISAAPPPRRRHGAAAPQAVNVSYAAGQTVSGFVVTPVGADGKVEVDASGATDVAVDVVGYFNPTALTTFVPLDPVRPVAGGAVAAHSIGFFDLTAGVPVANFTAALTGTVQVTKPHGDGELTVYESTGAPSPDTWQLHWTAGQTAANNVAAQVLNGINGVVGESFYNDSANPVNVTFDVTGYFAATYYY